MIVGVTGTNGAGKGTVVEYLVAQGFKHYSARDFIFAEIDRLGLTRDRNSTRDVANKLRQEYGYDYVARSLYERAKAAGGDAVIESLRTLKEAESLKRDGVIIFAVDADLQTRYERAVLRGSELDKISFETFVEQEKREMAQTAEWDMNVAGVMQMADAVFMNNGTREELNAQMDAALKKFRT